MNLRAHAALTLAPVIRAEQSLQHSFDDALNAVKQSERPYFHELIYGCLRHYEWVDAAFNQLITKKIKNKDADVRALILLGIYQLKFMHTPEHAVISETVASANALKKRWAKGFVNAVLRTFLREQTEIESKLAENESAHYTLPNWLLERLKEDWPKHWETISKQNRYQPPVTLRVNAQQRSREQALNDMSNAAIRIRPSCISPYGFSLESSGDIQKLDGLKSGWLSVQDEAAQLAATILDLAPGQRVLDACAAPGGKTCHILECENSLDVTALELDANRAALIQENLERLKLTANVKICDAIDIEYWWDNHHFDRILLDAPCSATGVVRRHPDIKLLRRADDLAKLAKIQSALFNTLWQCLAPGGIFVYATCSILKQENEHIASAFMKQHADAEHINLDSLFSDSTSSCLKQSFGHQLLPTKDAHDGFYYAKFKKQS